MSQSVELGRGAHRVAAACSARTADVARQFFFVHVMKTGGTSLVLHVLANFAPPEAYPSEKLDRRRPDDPEPYASIADLRALGSGRRASIRLYTGHMPFMARELIGSDVVTLSLLRAGRPHHFGAEALQTTLPDLQRAVARPGVRRPVRLPPLRRESPDAILCAHTRRRASRVREQYQLSRVRAAFDDPTTWRAGSEREVIALDDANESSSPSSRSTGSVRSRAAARAGVNNSSPRAGRDAQRRARR
jgi:hypothetical protein